MKKNTTCKVCRIGFTYCDKKVSGKYCSNTCYQEDRFERITIPNMLLGIGDAKTIRAYILSQTPYCSECGVGEEWNGQKLSLEIDHIDGDSTNNKPINLRVLCPNCHTQTDTYGVKNKGRSTRKFHS